MTKTANRPAGAKRKAAAGTADEHDCTPGGCTHAVYKAGAEFVTYHRAIPVELCQSIIEQPYVQSLQGVRPFCISLLTDRVPGVLYTPLIHALITLAEAPAPLWPGVTLTAYEETTLVQTGPGRRFPSHTDRIPKFPKRVLAVNAQLTDPSTYAGGSLVYSPGGPQNRNQGDVTVALATAVHEVTQVTAGFRYTCAAFFDGEGLDGRDMHLHGQKIDPDVWPPDLPAFRAGFFGGDAMAAVAATLK